MADIYGQLVKAQLENLTSDPSSPPEGLVYFKTDTNLVRWYDGASWRTAVDTDSTQTLSGKTLTSPVLNSPTVGTNLDMLAAAETRYYDADASNYVGFKAPSLSANKIWTLPTADGSANQTLKTDGSGALGWASTALTVTTTRGDIIYRDASSDARLAIGSNGKSLRAGANDPAWSWQETTSAKSADYTVTDTDGITVLLVTAAATRTITLPTAADNSGRRLTIIKVDNGSGYVTVDGEGAETVGGANDQTIYTQYGRMTIVCDGSNWQIVEGPIEGGVYAPTITNDNNMAAQEQGSISWTRHGNLVHFSLYVVVTPTGTGTITSINVTTPTPNKGGSANSDVTGTGTVARGNAEESQDVRLTPSTTSVFKAGYSNTTDTTARAWLCTGVYRIAT